MKYDILSLVTPDKSRQDHSDTLDECDHRRCYSIDPDIVYPATLEHFKAVLAGKASGQELLDGVETADAAKKLVGDVRRLGEDDIDLALIPFSQCSNLMDAEQRARRVDVLELARHWFSRALRVAVKKPIWVHILRRTADWRLS